MVDLIAKTACEGLLPLTKGTVTLSEITAVNVTSVAAYKGCAKAASDALEASDGLALPAPNRSTGNAKLRAIWVGPDQAFLIGAALKADLEGVASVTDQSDAWAIVKLSGAHAVDVLARLTPIDVRPSVFKRGHTAKTDLMHMMASITKTGPDTFEIMVFRSMAKTLVHDLSTAMATLAARDIA